MPSPQFEARKKLVDLLPRLRRFALVLARSADVADDLVQSSLERALGRLNQYKEGTRLDRWMFQIMKTVWLNNLRASEIRKVENLDDHDNEQAIDGVREMEAKLMLAEICATFESLPTGQRQALLLVSVEGYTYSEAAELLSVPIGTVISRLARGRAAIMAKQPPAEANNISLFQRKGN